MPIHIDSIAFLVAAMCAGVMGFAIQRGATCTVAAIDEVVGMRGVNRLAAMFAASLWVAGGLLVAHAFGVLGKMPAGYPVTLATIAGGVLLGLGAYVNRACVFGAIARFGSGEWAYAVTPLGFYAGCVAFGWIAAYAPHEALPQGSPLFAASPWLALLFVAFAAWRIARLFRLDPEVAQGFAARLRSAASMRLWTPHAATTVIGVTFVVMLLVVGAWAYTDALADLARNMTMNALARSLLLIALLGGATLGGWTAGRFRATSISVPQVARCFGGGALMGLGTLLIPGSNDGLILIGLPLLWPYAWVAFLTMCVSIGAVKLVERSATTRATNERNPTRSTGVRP